MVEILDKMTTDTIRKMMFIFRYSTDQGMQWNTRTLADQLDIPPKDVFCWRNCKDKGREGIV